MKIVIADDLPASALDLLRAEPGWVIDARSGRTPAALAADLADADALMVRSATQVDARLLDAAPQLRIVARAGTGVDNVDVAAASARGVLVVNAPGANSISVAEHALALMLALARLVPAADRAMKDGRWEKKRFLGNELRGKTLGVAGLGRIGQEVAQRARPFGMRIVAHDPYISAEVAAALGVELLTLDALCETSDYITLHLPLTAETRHVFDDARFSRLQARAQAREHRPRRADRRGGPSPRHRQRHRRRAQGWTCSSRSRQRTGRSRSFRRWSRRRTSRPRPKKRRSSSARTPRPPSAISCGPASVRNAVNFPALQADELQRLQPWIRLADQLGGLAAQMGTARIEALGVRYCGALTDSRAVGVLAASAAAGVLRPILSSGVSIVNARAAARERGIDIVESRSSRARDYATLLTITLKTDRGDRSVEGTVFEPNSLRLVSVRDVKVEAPLGGTMLIIANDDQPGVIGEVGTILGRHKVNIANFALGRNDRRRRGRRQRRRRSGLALGARRRRSRSCERCRPSAKRGSCD